MFGPEYIKINSLWKRDDKGKVLEGEWATDEVELLKDLPWVWTEKVDGTNIRLHYNGTTVVIGGRTDNAQVPAPLINNLAYQLDANVWHKIFSEADSVTVYGEGYGPKIQSGGQYRADQALVVFDILVNDWWLRRDDVCDIADKLGLEVVPEIPYYMDLHTAWRNLKGTANEELFAIKSQWP